MNLKGRSLLTWKDYTRDEIEYVLALARHTKESFHHSRNTLKGKRIVLLFEKSSTRTRCAFEGAMYSEGGQCTSLDLQSSHIGTKESLEDSARVLGRYYHGIAFRGFSQSSVDMLARHAGVPVWNALTDLYHPTQALADCLTIQEGVKKPLKKTKCVYVGDARNNVARSLMIMCAKLGMQCLMLAPAMLIPSTEWRTEVENMARENGGSMSFSDDVREAVKDADVLYTDVWVSMGEEKQLRERVELLTPYRVTPQMIKETHNPEVLFLHCLPSIHNFSTQYAQKLKEKGIDVREVEDEVFRSSHSKVFLQAENRLHTIKAILIATLGT